MKPLYLQEGRAILKVNKIFSKEKVLDEKTQKFKTVETHTYGNRGEVVSATSDALKKGQNVMFNFYGSLQVKEEKKFALVIVDYEDINVKL
jgi:hypothetical protein